MSRFGHVPKAVGSWSALCLFFIAPVQTPEAADHILPEGLELHQSQVCCHLNLIVPW